MASRLSICRAQVHVPDTCAHCESIQDVNWYCNDCQEALCDKCKDGHKRVKKTRNDDVVPIKKANKLGGVVLPEVCKTHRGKTCDLYCSDCNIVMCAMCFTEKHKQHIFKTIEEEIGVQKQNMQDQLNILKSKLAHLDDTLSKRHEVSKSFKESVDVIQQTVQIQRQKLTAEINSIADSIMAELSSLVEEEEKSHNQECQSHEKNIKDIKQLIKKVEENTETMSSTSVVELTGRLRTTIPLYDVTKKSVILCPPEFVPGTLNPYQLKSMIGYSISYEKKAVDSKQVSQISTFRVPQKKPINSICTIDDTHIWMSVFGSKTLIKVNKEGKVTESVNLDFEPWCLTLTNTGELLMTRVDVSPLIHKLSKDKQVTRFTDISPLKAHDISVSDSDEVFVTTDTETIQVLNMSGESIRQISCEYEECHSVCLTTGSIVVTTRIDYDQDMIVINNTGQINKWGDIKAVTNYFTDSIARDRYDRVFVTDALNDEVCVISENEGKTKRLLHYMKHGVTRPRAVCVNRCGHVWIGCYDGTVHVMEL